jgi:thiol:disulfide interchange protein
VVWLLWVYGEQTSPRDMAWLLAALTALAFALWLLGRRPAMRSPRLRVTASLVSAAALVLALGLPLSGSAPAAGEARMTEDADGEPWSEQRLAELRAAGRPVLVNMTAAWCITCLANERVALSTETVRQALAAHDVAYLKGDWTRRRTRSRATSSVRPQRRAAVRALSPRRRRAPRAAAAADRGRRRRRHPFDAFSTTQETDR